MNSTVIEEDFNYAIFPIDTFGDLGNVVYDFGAAVVNHISGDHQAAKDNRSDLVLDYC